MIGGFSNKNNANDNTSGVATILSILGDLPEEQRAKVCIIFFDEEEKGLKGSQAFLLEHKATVENMPLINLDCVANGKYLLISEKNNFYTSDYHDLLEKSIRSISKQSKNVIVGTSKEYVIPSDHFIFKNSLGISAVHKNPWIGYYLKDVHTSKDRIFNHENIKIIKDIMLDFIDSL